MESGFNMNIKEIIKALDEIEKISLEGWDYNNRVHFLDVIEIASEIRKGLKND